MYAANQEPVIAQTIRIHGTVQGVGFRPLVWKLAQQFNLRGRVWNDAEGLVIQVWGNRYALDDFRECLVTDRPPLAHIENILTTPLYDLTNPDDFQICDSEAGEVLTNVSPDAASCPQCLAEINDPANRRYRYAFTNCTHCGPRFSIIKGIPYDRVNTSMQSFRMCPACQAEYDNPVDRRFHAQPNACPNCGPSVWLEDVNRQRVTGNFIDAIAQAASLIQQGYIVAIKGIGGFHLTCDANNATAVRQLRQRKQRYHKPFALMARDINVIRRYANVSLDAQMLLQDSAAPIVILAKHLACMLTEDINPGQSRLGFMLPYTPLHTLLLQEIDTPLVMTSGNRSDEAQCISNEQAHIQLQGIADFFLLHDREIVNRLDDSVTRVVNKQTQLLRRARGYAPQPLKLPAGFESSPAILAMGAELKNTFCLLQEGKAILSQHQGDLEDASVFHAYRHNIDLYRQLFDHQPTMIVIDKHPDYISSQYGLQLAATEMVDVITVQHHHAHMAACMAEHGLPSDSQPVLGIVLDGLGYGDNGELWGGEFLLADYCQATRVAHFQSVAMPGGNRAMPEPWRNTFAHLQQSLGWQQVAQQYPDLAFVKFMQDKDIANLIRMISNGINSPLVSSAGRLFDAVAALLGICTEAVSYEGQAAMQLEALAENSFATSTPFPFQVIDANHDGVLTIQWHDFWQAVLADLQQGVSTEVIAGRFHQTLVAMMLDVVQRLATMHAFNTVVLSGGVMQNRLLAEHLTAELSQRFTVITASQVPANDGAISLGQVVVAAAQVLSES